MLGPKWIRVEKANSYQFRQTNGEPVNLKRYENNPIITVDDVTPSREGWNVHYVMNAGCHRVGEDVLLLLRVAEVPDPDPDPNIFLAP